MFIFTDQMCRDVNGEDLFVEEESFLYEDGDDMCRIFTCMVGICTYIYTHAGIFI